MPMRFQSRGGRKRIVALAGSEIVPTKKLRPECSLVKAHARLWRWQPAEGGLVRVIRGLAEAERISHSYVGRIVRLNLLAPDIVERILGGRPAAGLVQFLRPFPIEWGKAARMLRAPALRTLGRWAPTPVGALGQ